MLNAVSGELGDTPIDIRRVALHFLFVSADQEMEKIVKEIMELSVPNRIHHAELHRAIERQKFQDEKRYALISILRYNPAILSSDVLPTIYHSSFLTAGHFIDLVRHVDDIDFSPTLSVFQQMNELILLMVEQPGPQKAKHVLEPVRHQKRDTTCKTLRRYIRRHWSAAKTEAEGVENADEDNENEKREKTCSVPEIVTAIQRASDLSEALDALECVENPAKPKKRHSSGQKTLRRIQTSPVMVFA